ncbi:MAG: metallophosphoesterase [Alistipes sp.]|nr:metallophosphoesterase [Alistipes sp.]
MRILHTFICGIFTVAAALLAPSALAQTVTYTHDGATIELRKISIEVGAEKPFSVLHISDSHLAYADERDGESKEKLAKRRIKIFRTPEATLRAHREYAKEGSLTIVHTGDMIDFVSEKNLEIAKDIFSEGDWIVCAGNHEYSLYVGEAKEDAAYRAKSYDKVQAVYPNNLTFHSRVVNGVNFVTLDNGYYQFSKEQFARMKKEVKRGLPIVMVCHNPLYTPEMCERIQRGNKTKATGLTGVPRHITDEYYHKERPAGEEWRNRSVQQRANKTTLKFCKWLKKQEELKAILTGHCHFYFKTQFSPTAVQYTVGSGYKGAGYIVEIK